MFSQPAPVDPIDMAYERIFLEMPTHGWRRYDFRTMSHAERSAAAMLVKIRAAELRLQCTVKIPGSKHELRVVAVVSGAYMDASGGGQSLKRELWSVGPCLPGWRDSSTAILNAHKSALRLTVEGERTRELHRAGLPGALWNTLVTAPGEVHLEKIEVVPPVDAPTAALPPVQATAISSVGDINVTLNVSPPEIVILESDDASPANDDSSPGPQKSFFTVKHWRELAIGIDSHWRYWAKTPAPAVGEPFRKTDAHELELPGERWKTLLKLLAESPTGNCCDTSTLIREYGYLPPISSIPQDSRARPGSLEKELASSLRQQAAASLNRLKDAVSDLARELREQIKGPKGRDQRAALRVDGEVVRSGFVVGFLVPDDSGYLIFRHQLS
jgi:hypothetical protein